MRGHFKPDSTKGERWKRLHAFEPVSGIELMVCEPGEDPDTVNLVMAGTADGYNVLCEIDRTDPGARARAISLGDAIRDALELAALTWDIDDDGNPIVRSASEG
jgi:hypothetical protein